MAYVARSNADGVPIAPMTPRDRLLATLAGRPADRVPLVLPEFHSGCPDEVSGPGRREILERVVEHIHFWHFCPSFDNRYLMTPPQRMREVKREERHGEITVTTEINTPKGKLTAVTASNSVSRTLWCVAGMMPYQCFLEFCATELGLLKEPTAQCRERILRVLDVLLAPRSVEYVWIGGCEWLTPPMGSPELYQTLVQEVERPVIDRIHAAGALCHVHCHGNVRSTLEAAIARGADYFEPVEPPPDGDITFSEAKALAAGRITLGGNIEGRILQNAGADAVAAATRNAFEGGKERMILQPTAGPISEMDPRQVANYHRMIDVWEELSPI